MRRAFKPVMGTYVPVDEYMERPRVRVLLAIRFQDWITANDLFEILDLPLDVASTRDNYARQLCQLVREQLLERKLRAPGSRIFVYRLAPDVDLTIPPPNLDVPGTHRRRFKPTRSTAKWRAARRGTATTTGTTAR